MVETVSLAPARRRGSRAVLRGAAIFTGSVVAGTGILTLVGISFPASALIALGASLCAVVLAAA